MPRMMQCLIRAYDVSPININSKHFCCSLCSFKLFTNVLNLPIYEGTVCSYIRQVFEDDITFHDIILCTDLILSNFKKSTRLLLLPLSVNIIWILYSLFLLGSRVNLSKRLHLHYLDHDMITEPYRITTEFCA